MAAEHHADLHANLVYKKHRGPRLGDVGGQFPQGLAHQAGLQTDVDVAHVALDLGPRRQGGHTVDDHDVNGV